MSELNPYAAPTADADASGQRAVLDEDRVITSEVLEVLQQTRSWVQMLGVVGFIGCGIMAAGGLVAMALSARFLGGMSLWIGLTNVALAALYVFPCLALLRYGRSIGDIQRGQGVHALVDALRHQKAFWRYVGILSIVFMVIITSAFSVVTQFIGAGAP